MSTPYISDNDIFYYKFINRITTLENEMTELLKLHREMKDKLNKLEEKNNKSSNSFSCFKKR